MDKQQEYLLQLLGEDDSKKPLSNANPKRSREFLDRQLKDFEREMKKLRLTNIK